MQQFRDDRRAYLQAREQRRQDLQMEVDDLESAVSRNDDLFGEDYDFPDNRQDQELSPQPGTSADAHVDLESTRRSLKRSAELGATGYLAEHWSAWNQDERRRDFEATADYVRRLPQGRSDESRTARGALDIINQARSEVQETGCHVLENEMMPPNDARDFVTRMDSIINSKYSNKY